MTRFSRLKTAAAALCLALAAGTAHAAQFERASGAGDPVEADVSVDRASRIAIEGMRIDSAVWDREEMDLQTDPKSGQIFVLPRRTGDLSLFVTTESGETAALLLHAKEDARAGNIILRLKEKHRAEGTDTRSSAMLAPMPASDYEGALKRFASAVFQNEETPSVMRRSSCPKPSATLTLILERLEALRPERAACWSARGLEGTLVRVVNPKAFPVEIREAALIGPRVAAVVTEKPVLAMKASGSILIVEAADE